MPSAAVPVSVPLPPADHVQSAGKNFVPLILVIDDSATIRHITTTYLEREGFEVMAFPDGVEALRWLASPCSRIPDLVVLDIGLPKMDGYEVARRLTTKTPLQQTVLVMLTRRDGTIDRLKGRLAGASHYLTKPFQVHELVHLVYHALALRSGAVPPDVSPRKPEVTR
ncbi:MAG: response regulator [Ktedonobacteraceae bacterium]|nr:response regulator [Ktedonobacteraceae bacterium]